MARKKKHEEHENHERWLVSYADFITLLFAFFVVMYSVSSVNEGKYRVLSSTMVTAFHRPVKSLHPIQVGTQSKAMPSRIILQSTKAVMVEIPGIPGSRGGKKEKGEGEKAEKEEKKKKEARKGGKKDFDDLSKKQGLRSSGVVMRKIGEDLEKALSSLIDQGLVSINKDSQRVEVQIKSNVLYQSGSATISLDAIPVLEKIGKILSLFPNEVMVEGYTDNIPISNMIYPSNWELSAARSASVVHLFMKSGIDPKRLTATGYAEFRPIADNKTEEGRSKNRRVVLVIPAELEAKAIVESLTGAGIGIGGRKQDDVKDKDKAEESLISNIKLKRDSLPDIDFSPSEVVEPVKIKPDVAGADKSKDTVTDKATDTILDEKPGVFPVKLSPFQLPDLPRLKSVEDQGQAQKDQVETDKGKTETVNGVSNNKPSLKGQVKTIHTSDEKQIQEDRKVKLKRTTDVGREVGLQPVIIKKSIESDGQRGSQQDGSSPSVGGGRKGSFPIIRLPAVPGLNVDSPGVRDTNKAGQPEAQQPRSPMTNSSPVREGTVKGLRSESGRKVILNRITAPSYESTPQVVPAPQSVSAPQQGSGKDVNINNNRPTKRQSEQGSTQEGQQPRFIAPPIRLPFGDVGSPDVTDANNNIQSSGDQP